MDVERSQGGGADDALLVRRAAAGDELAFELLVRRHAGAAHAFARALLRDAFAAEEAVQDTFLRAYGNLDRFRGDSSVRTWLLAICRHACLDRLRRREAVVVPLDRVREERAAEQHPELRVLLERAVAALPAEEREAFTLVDVLGYSREEAAGVVGVPASTMRSRVARARLHLADAIEPDLPKRSRR